MSLARNKKGIEFTTLIEIILVVIAAGLLIGVFTYASSRADEKTSETLCRTFNALRFRTEVETPVGNINLAPRACKTIDKEDLPGKDYKSYAGISKDEAKAQLRDMIAKCWWMWLEGNKLDMFDQSPLALLSQNKCFVCYTFSINKEAEFSFQEFAASLNEPYYAVDTSDRCAPLGQGGKCMALASCEKDFPREAVSSRCKPGEKCCISKDVKDECINKGGSCESKTGYSPYGKWSCKQGKCFVEEKNFASYLDYVQGTKGAGGGAGAVIFGDDDGKFSSGSKYAITFISPGRSWNWNTVAGITGTVGLAGLTVVGLYSGIGTIPTIVLLKLGIVGGTITTAAGYITGLTGEAKNVNLILVSKYDTVSSKCAIESGVGEK